MPSMVMSLNTMLLTSLPRSRFALMRIAWSVPLKVTRSTSTFCTPPAISLPIDTPCPWSKVQSVIVMFLLGASPPGEPGWPLLIATLSSPTSSYTWSITTLLELNGSIASVFGEGIVAVIRTLRMTTSSE